jgi:PAS domain-containing protein
MTFRQDDAETIALALNDAPRLAEAPVPTYDDRLQDLMQGQQEVMNRVFGSGSLQDVLGEIVLVCERVFAPAQCVLSLFYRGGISLTHQAASPLPSRLLETVGIATGDQLPDPTASSMLSGERIIVADFSDDGRWEEHAELAVACGFRSCWVEPVSDCGEGLVGFVTLYSPEAREPNAADEQVLWTLTSFVGFVVNAAQREMALRAAKDQFAALVSAIPGVVYQRVVTPEGGIRYTYISESARDLFGVSADEILADPEALFRTHSPEYKARFRERLLAASKQLAMWDVEATLITPDGRKRYTHALARPDLQADGSVLWTGVILDETRTREAIFDSLSQGFLLYDAQDRMVMRNSQYLKLYPGLCDVAVPGATYEEVAKDELAGAAGMAVASVAYDSQLRERLERHKTPRSIFEQQLDDMRWILIDEQRTGDGGTVILYTDISDMKRRDKQL